MSPSIGDLFGNPELDEDNETEVDLDKVLNSVTDILNDRHSEPESPAAEPADETPQDEPAGTAPEEPGEEVAEPEVVDAPRDAPAAPPSSDPFLELPAERRAALLALDQAIMDDEGKRAAVFGILSGTPAEQPKVDEKLPEHIDPDSFEAQLWRGQQDQRKMLEQISQATREQREAFAKQQANTAAMTAGNAFAQRYEGKLTKDDVLAIAKHAGASGLAGALMAQNSADPVSAFNQALEATLWGNEAWREKVVGEEVPVKQPGDTTESKDRKRKLTAVGSAASPVSGPSPKRSPVETGADGRIAEKSRQELVKELANGMARQSGGEF